MDGDDTVNDGDILVLDLEHDYLSCLNRNLPKVSEEQEVSAIEGRLHAATKPQDNYIRGGMEPRGSWGHSLHSVHVFDSTNYV